MVPSPHRDMAFYCFARKCRCHHSLIIHFTDNINIFEKIVTSTNTCKRL